MKARKHKLIIDATTPTVYPSNMFLDSLIEETVGNLKGIPGGLWISISGAPGTCKTTLGTQALNGFGMNPNVYTLWVDREQELYRCKQMYDRLGLEYISELDTKDDIGFSILERIYSLAKELEPQGKTLVALVDSWMFLCQPSTIENQRKIAEYIRKNRDTHKNLILITVNHLVKGNSIGGPVEVQQKPDVLLSIKKKNGFLYLTAPKNRVVAPGAPDVIKLSVTDKGLAVSHEPDFVSTNPLVQLYRSWKK